MTYSVLMTAYIKDNPTFLKIALESIYEKQTRKPDEIVVVFDGELTKELYYTLEEFRTGKEGFVHYFPQDKNMGRGEALRIGAEKCLGDYIFIMDSDDISVPERFEKQIDYVEKHPEIDVLGANIAEFEFSPCEEKKRLRICPQKNKEIVKMSKRRNPMNQVTVCIKKTALLSCGNYENVLRMEDYYLWMKMIVNGCHLENMDDILVYVRIGNGFNQRRGLTVQIRGWAKLQKLMLKNKIIRPYEAVLNMIYIVGFTFCPGRVKQILYDTILRRNV